MRFQACVRACSGRGRRGHEGGGGGRVQKKGQHNKESVCGRKERGKRGREGTSSSFSLTFQPTLHPTNPNPMHTIPSLFPLPPPTSHLPSLFLLTLLFFCSEERKVAQNPLFGTLVQCDAVHGALQRVVVEQAQFQLPLRNLKRTPFCAQWCLGGGGGVGGVRRRCRVIPAWGRQARALSCGGRGSSPARTWRAPEE